MNKTIALLVLILMPQLAKAQSVTIGLIDYPPHLDFETDISKSKLYRYINKTFSNKGFTVKYEKYPKKRGKKELQRGAIDLLLPFDDNADGDIQLLTKPLFHSIPGLCFKKDKFIPILSAAHRFKKLRIGIPPGVDIVSPLQNSGAVLVTLEGTDATNRGIDLAQRGRLDAFYHPSPLKMYHQNNQRFKEVVCSYFHGYPNGVYIAASPTIKQHILDMLDKALTEAIDTLSYEYYFAK